MLIGKRLQEENYMFGFGKKKKEEKIYSPINGQLISIENVPDTVFAEKMMGDGVGFILEEGTIYAPCDCELTMIAETKHAIGLRTPLGLELLIHIGLDTVTLNGRGFSILKSAGETVTRGEPLVKIDLETLRNQEIDLTTPMVFTNGADFEIAQLKENPNVVTMDELFTIKTKKE